MGRRFENAGAGVIHRHWRHRRCGELRLQGAVRSGDELMSIAVCARLVIDGPKTGYRWRRVTRFEACRPPQCARNCVMNVCSSRASTASGANASATASAVW